MGPGLLDEDPAAGRALMADVGAPGVGVPDRRVDGEAVEGHRAAGTRGASRSGLGERVGDAGRQVEGHVAAVGDGFAASVGHQRRAGAVRFHTVPGQERAVAVVDGRGPAVPPVGEDVRALLSVQGFPQLVHEPSGRPHVGRVGGDELAALCPGRVLLMDRPVELVAGDVLERHVLGEADVRDGVQDGAQPGAARGHMDLPALLRDAGQYLVAVPHRPDPGEGGAPPLGGPARCEHLPRELGAVERGVVRLLPHGVLGCNVGHGILPSVWAAPSRARPCRERHGRARPGGAVSSGTRR